MGVHRAMVLIDNVNQAIGEGKSGPVETRLAGGYSPEVVSQFSSQIFSYIYG